MMILFIVILIYVIRYIRRKCICPIISELNKNNLDKKIFDILSNNAIAFVNMARTTVCCYILSHKDRELDKAKDFNYFDFRKMGTFIRYIMSPLTLCLSEHTTISHWSFFSLKVQHVLTTPQILHT
jgi:hypothetical protein